MQLKWILNILLKPKYAMQGKAFMDNKFHQFSNCFEKFSIILSFAQVPAAPYFNFWLRLHSSRAQSGDEPGVWAGTAPKWK